MGFRIYSRVPRACKWRDLPVLQGARGCFMRCRSTISAGPLCGFLHGGRDDELPSARIRSNGVWVSWSVTAGVDRSHERTIQRTCRFHMCSSDAGIDPAGCGACRFRRCKCRSVHESSNARRLLLGLQCRRLVRWTSRNCSRTLERMCLAMKKATCSSSHYAELLRLKGWMLSRKGDLEGAEKN